MEYAVDIVKDIMFNLSSSEPVFFQRGGSLYIASKEGFAQVPYGLATEPRAPNDYREERKEILESKDAIYCWVGDRYDKKPKFRKGEKERLAQIMFGSDDNSFSLEEITKASEELQKLPDDGKIRLITHGSGYHSHKYGYACDGIDVWVRTARVMDREGYLELIRAEEEGFYQEIQRLIEEKTHLKDDDIRFKTSESYKSLRFPDCIVMTPNVLVSLPRKGVRLELHRREPDSWTIETRLRGHYDGYNHGGILYYYSTLINTHRESPFNVSVTINAYNLNAKNGQEFERFHKNFIGAIDKELGAVSTAVANSNGFFSRLNNLHNELCAEDIQWIKI